MIAHLAASTITALVAAAVCLAIPRLDARWRFWILLAGVLRFALPTGWLVSLGSLLAPRTPAPLPLPGWLLHPGVTRAAAIPGIVPSRTLEWIVWCLWIAGAAASLAVWARRLAARTISVREPSAREAGIFQRAGSPPDIQLRIAPCDAAFGVRGIWRACVVLPDGVAGQLDDTELEAVLAHEVVHAERHDNLWAAVAGIVRSTFWFHPLLWWMERQMLEAREQACDDRVLARVASPGDYAAGILKVCRIRYAGAAGYAGIGGSDLQSRMERIMNGKRNGGSRWLGAASALITVCAAMAPLAGGYLNAQTPSQTDAREVMKEAESLFAQGEKAQAIETLRAEAEKQPTNDALRIALANTEVRAGIYDAALADYQAVLSRLDPASAAAGDIHLRMGETLRRKSDDTAAAQQLRRAMQILPQSTAVRSTLALVLDHSGHWQEAHEMYRSVLTLDPNNGIAQNNLAYLMSEHGGDLDLALERAKRAHELLPGLDETSDTLAWIYIRKQMAREAIDLLRPIVLHNPQQAAFRGHLATALEMTNERPDLVALLRAEPTASNQKQLKDLIEAWH